MSRGHSLVRSRGTPHAPVKKELGSKWNSKLVSRGINYVTDEMISSISDKKSAMDILKDLKFKTSSLTPKRIIPEKPKKISVQDLSTDQLLYYTCKYQGYNVAAQGTDHGPIFKDSDTGKPLKYGLDNGYGRYLSALPRRYLEVHSIHNAIESFGISFRKTERGTWLVELLDKDLAWMSIEGTNLMETLLRMNVAYIYGMEVDNV